MSNSSYINYGLINILGGPASGLPAQYRLIEPHWINNIYYDIDTVITEGVEIPFDWIPTLAVDPVNFSGAVKMWAAGPRDVATAVSNDLNVFSNLYRSPKKPVTYWIELATGKDVNASYVNYGPINISMARNYVPQRSGQFQLTGLGASLGQRGA